MDEQKQKALVDTMSELAAVLKKRGFTDQQVDELIIKVVAEVEAEVIEYIMNSLSDEQKKLLSDMTEANKTTDEIIDALQLDGEKIHVVETQIFTDIVKKIIKE